MAVPAGFAGQLGFKSETTVGTPVTVDQFHPGLLSAEFTASPERLDSQGIKAGRHVIHAWKAGAQRITGSVELELWDEPLATLLRHMFGTIATTGAGPFTHTASPGDLTGQALTIQVGVPDINGTVQPFTYAGCKIGSFELGVSVDEIATLSLDIVAMTEATGTALAAASYPASAPFVFTEGSLSLAGTEVATVSEATVNADNNITERVKLNAATSKEPLQNGIRSYTADITAEFENLTIYNRVLNGTEVVCELKLDNGTDSLTIDGNFRSDSETPQLSGPEIVEQSLTGTFLSGTSDVDAMQAVLVNNESAST